jgi:multidrug efflux pump subunit AcrB
MDIDLSEVPIMNINLSGDYDLPRLKVFAKLAQDKIEGLKEITRVDIVGALDREIQVDVNMYRMQAAGLTFAGIEQAISFNNMTVSGGNISMNGMSRSVRVSGEISEVETIRNINLTSSSGA